MGTSIPDNDNNKVDNLSDLEPEGQDLNFSEEDISYDPQSPTSPLVEQSASTIPHLDMSKVEKLRQGFKEQGSDSSSKMLREAVKVAGDELILSQMFVIEMMSMKDSWRKINKA